MIVNHSIRSRTSSTLHFKTRVCAYSGEIDHRFRWQTDHLFRSKPITPRSGATLVSFFYPVVIAFDNMRPLGRFFRFSSVGGKFNVATVTLRPYCQWGRESAHIRCNCTGTPICVHRIRALSEPR